MAQNKLDFEEKNQYDEYANVPVYGRNPVVALLKSGTQVDTLLIASSLDEKSQSYFTALAKSAGAVVKATRNEKLDKLCVGGVHQGIAAYASNVEYYSLDELLKKAEEKNETPFILIADGIEDPHNLGALMRTALLCGAHGVVIPKRGGTAVTPVVLKAAAGAAFALPIARVANIGEAVRCLKKANVFVYCADASGYPVYKQNLSGAVALVVGNEGKGVSPLVKKLCDTAISLPMVAQNVGVDSFNVSVAGGIVMYEIFRQRTAL